MSFPAGRRRDPACCVLSTIRGTTGRVRGACGARGGRTRALSRVSPLSTEPTRGGAIRTADMSSTLLRVPSTMLPRKSSPETCRPLVCDGGLPSGNVRLALWDNRPAPPETRVRLARSGDAGGDSGTTTVLGGLELGCCCCCCCCCCCFLQAVEQAVLRKGRAVVSHVGHARRAPVLLLEQPLPLPQLAAERGQIHRRVSAGHLHEEWARRPPGLSEGQRAAAAA